MAHMMHSDIEKARTCACGNIRQTDSVVTQFYDGVLAPGGLTAVQFSLLGAITALAPVTLNHLAKVMDMDRATLSRHLKILADRDLLRNEEDQRTTHIRLTSEGEQLFENAWPLWQTAQQYIEQTFGMERFDAFLSELKEIRTLLSAGIS